MFGETDERNFRRIGKNAQQTLGNRYSEGNEEDEDRDQGAKRTGGESNKIPW